MTKEEEIDVHLLIATFRCFHEQLYLMKGKHSNMIKYKFNRLINVARQYENEVVKLYGNSKECELIYDELMEILIEVKQQILKDK